MQVKIIQPKGEAALVEWTHGGNVYRCIIPAAEIDKEGNVLDSVLEAGVPYGVQWSQVEPGIVTGEMIEQALHRAGIWTFDDLQKQSKAAIGAIQSTYGVTLSSLYQFAKTGDKYHGR